MVGTFLRHSVLLEFCLFCHYTQCVVKHRPKNKRLTKDCYVVHLRQTTPYNIVNDARHLLSLENRSTSLIALSPHPTRTSLLTCVMPQHHDHRHRHHHRIYNIPNTTCTEIHVQILSRKQNAFKTDQHYLLWAVRSSKQMEKQDGKQTRRRTVS